MRIPTSIKYDESNYFYSVTWLGSDISKDEMDKWCHKQFPQIKRNIFLKWYHNLFGDFNAKRIVIYSFKIGASPEIENDNNYCIFFNKKEDALYFMMIYGWNS